MLRSKYRLLFLSLLILLVPASMFGQDMTVISREDQVRFFAPTSSGQTGLFETVTADTLRQGDMVMSSTARTSRDTPK